MNLVITTTNSKAWQTVRRHYFTAFTGVSLTLIALVGSAALNDTTASDDRSTVARAPAVHRAASVQIASSPVMTYYIVGSQEQLQAVRAEADARVKDNTEYAPKTDWKFSILLASTPAEAADALGIVDAAKARWKAAGASGLEVVDLRTR